MMFRLFSMVALVTSVLGFQSPLPAKVDHFSLNVRPV